MVDWRFLSGGRDFIVCFWKLLSLNLERFLWLFSVFISTIFILFITTFLSWFRHLIRLAILLHDLVWENSLYFHEKSSKKTLKFPMFYPIFLWIKKMYFPSFVYLELSWFDDEYCIELASSVKNDFICWICLEYRIQIQHFNSVLRWVFEQLILTRKQVDPFLQ